MHLIKIQIFNHASNLASLNFKYLRFQSRWGLYDPSIGRSPPESSQLPDKTKQKVFGYAHKV